MEAGTYERYELVSLEDGRIQGMKFTNDGQDKGEPGEEESWPVSYDNMSQMAKRTGLSHTGMNGCKVTVVVDGEVVWR